jgi:hypothetical protein
VAAEAKGDLKEKLEKYLDTAKDAAQRAQELAQQQNPSGQPGNQQGDKPNPESKNNPAKDPKASDKPNDPSGNPSDKAGEILKDLQKLEPKLQRMDPNAPELKQMKEAMEALKQSMNPSGKQPSTQTNNPTEKPVDVNTPRGGEAFNKAHKAMLGVASGLSERIERLIRSRDIHQRDTDNAPKEYKPLVDRYFKALSEDVEPEK